MKNAIAAAYASVVSALAVTLGVGLGLAPAARAATLQVPTDYATLQAAVNAATAGDTVYVEDGSYTLSGALNILKPLTLVGESESGVVINATANGTGYGIHVEANNVSLKNFTLLPPLVPAARGTSGGGGFAVHASFNHTAPYSAYANLTLEHITIVDGNRAPFDIHGYDGVVLNNLTANNAAYGNGIQLTGCTDVHVSGCAASGNAWGGLAFYCSKGTYLNRPCSGIIYAMGDNSIADVYVEDEFSLVNSVTIQAAAFRVDNVYTPTNAMHRYTAGDAAAAAALGTMLNTKYSNTASVAFDLISGELRVMAGFSIQAAVNAATAGSTITVAAGTYNENVNVTKSLKLVSVSGKAATTIRGSAAQATARAGGNLGTVCLFANNTSVGTNETSGFTIVGYDWTSPGIEHAAVYIKPTVDSGLLLCGNTLTADGEAALLCEYGHPNTSCEIAHNLINGKTYVGDTVGGNSSVQDTVANVPRSLVYISGNTKGVYFHDNVLSASVGGLIAGSSPATTYFNTGATLDCNGATGLAEGARIINNTFSVGSWAALRARGPYTTSSGNVFDSTATGADGLCSTYYQNAGSAVFSGNVFLHGTGRSGTLAADAQATVRWDLNAADVAITHYANGSVQVVGAGWTNLISTAAVLDFADQDLTVASIPYLRRVPADYATLQAAIAASLAGDTINVATGTYTEVGQIVIDKSLSIVGADPQATVIKPAQDTGSADAARGWFVVAEGVTFNLQGVTLDGTGRKVFQAVRHQGSGLISDCVFTNIQYEASGPAYQGTAIAVHSVGTVDVLGCTFAGIGRNGIAAYDIYWPLPLTGPTGTYSGNTYVGKGAGDWLDYAFLVQGGAKVTITGNLVSDCVGVASVDNSGSCGIAVWDDPGTEVTATSNLLVDNASGLAIAIWYGGTSDPRVDIGDGNLFVGGDVGVDLQNVGGVPSSSPAITFGASIFKGQVSQAISLQGGVAAGLTYDITSVVFKDGADATITDNYAKESLVYHASDATNRGLLLWAGNQAYVPVGGDIQTAIAATPENGTLNLQGGTYTGDINTVDGKDMTLACGASPARVIIDGSLTMESGDVLSVEIEGDAPGTGYDQWVVVSGGVSLGGATLTVTRGYTPAVGTVFTIIDNDGSDAVSGLFAGLVEGATFAADDMLLQVSYAGGTGNDVLLTVLPPPVTYVDDDYTDGACGGHVWGYDAFATIQGGVTGVAVDGTVSVAAGTYDENVNVSKSVSVIGERAATTIVDGGRAGTVFTMTDSGSDVLLEGLTIQNGLADDGGGIVAVGGLTVSKCVVSRNSANYQGGGIYLGGATAYIVDSTIVSNAAPLTGTGARYGGGVFADNTALAIVNSTVSANAAKRGGGIYMSESDAELTHVTVTLNQAGTGATDGGGGLYIFGNTQDLNNTIVAGNTATVGANIRQSSNTRHDSSVVIDQNALLAGLADNGGPTPTHALLAGSPALNAGSASAVTVDQRGVPRDQGNNPDVGAFETAYHTYADDGWTGPSDCDGHAWGADAFATVQAAVNAVWTDGTVSVAAGSYAESVTVTKALSLLGANKDVAGSGARGDESVLSSAGTALTIGANNVTVKGFQLAGAVGAAVNNHIGVEIRNNVVTCAAVGIQLQSITTAAPAGVTVADNQVAMTAQLAGATPTVAVALTGLAGDQAVVVQDNDLAGGFYGYLLYAVNTSPKTTIRGGTVSGVMQGVAVINVDPQTGTVYAPTTFGVDGVAMSAFAGDYPALSGYNFHAGVYVFTGGNDPAAAVAGQIENVNISGTGRIGPDCAGLYFGDFSTGAGPRQSVAVASSAINDNLNRGLYARGANAAVAVSDCEFLRNGADPRGLGGNQGFGLMVRNGATVDVTGSRLVNPAAVTAPYRVYAASADTAGALKLNNSSLDNSGNAAGLLASGLVSAGTNWWSTAVEAEVAALTAGGAVYTPWYSDEASTNLVPYAITLSAAAVNENVAPGTAIGTLGSTDSDGGAPVYTLANGGGLVGADNASFAIDGTALQTLAALDFETKSSYTVCVQVSDGNGGVNWKTFDVTVTDINEAPTIDQGASLSQTLDEDGAPLAWSAPALSAADPDSGNTLTWSLVAGSGPTHGDATVSGTGASPSTFTYVPDGEYNGTDSFVVKVADQFGGEDTVTVNVTVNPINDAPVCTLDPSVTGTHHVGQTLTAVDGTWNDLLDTSISGTSTVSLDYQWQRANDALGTGAADIAGAVDGTYGVGLADNGKYVRVRVRGTDDGVGLPLATQTSAFSAWSLVDNVAPVITEGAGPVAVGMDEDNTPAPWSLTLNVTDADAIDTLTWSIASPASHGTASAPGDGLSKAIGYEPEANYNGTDSFTVKVADGLGSEDTITVNVTVAARNDKPVCTETPGLTGLRQVGQTLTATSGTWNDELDTAVSGSSVLSYGYQWQRSANGTDWDDIAGATLATYTLTADDSLKSVRVQVTATDTGVGEPASEEQAATSAAVDVKPVRNATQGSYHNTIQDALDAALSGDTITVADGTYAEGPVIAKPLTLQASGAGYTVDGDLTFNAKPIVVTGATLAAGKVWRVSTNAVIQQAIASANDHDTVKVLPGTYRERVTLSKPITVSGDAGDGAAGPGPDAPILDGDVDNNGTPDQGDGFTIPRNTNLSGITVEGFIVQNFGNGGAGNGVGVGVISWENTSSNVTIQDNEFRSLGYNGVYVGTDTDDMQSGWLVQRNVIIGAPYAGIELTDVRDSQVLDNVIQAPAALFDDPGDAGVGIEIAARARKGAVTTSNIVVSGNIISGAFAAGSRAGINLLARAYNDVGTGALLTGVTVQNNEVLGSGTRGVYLVAESRNGKPSAVSNISVTQNILTGGTAGIEIGGTFVAPKANGSYDVASITVQDNNLADNTVAGLNNVAAVSVGAERNWWGAASGPTVATNPDGEGVAVSALVNYSPWLSLGTDMAPATGFQPNTGDVTYIDPTCSLAPRTVTYSGLPQDANAPTVVGGAVTSTLYRLDGTAGDWLASATDAGVYDVQISVDGDADHNDGVFEHDQALTIEKKTLTVTATASQSKVYGAADPAYAYAHAGEENGEVAAFAGALAREAGENVGAYEITAGTLALADNGAFLAANYALAVTEDVTFAITKKTLTVTPTAGQSKVYGAADPAFAYTDAGEENGEVAAFAGALARDAGENVGAYEITEGTLTLADNGAFLASNYTLVFTEDVTFAITQKAVTVVADPKSKNAGQANPELTAVVTGAEDGDTINYTLSTDADVASAVGVYAITVTLGGNPNYDVSKTDSTLTVVGAAQDCPGFRSPSASVVVSNSFAYAAGETLESLTWTPALPAGWTLTSATGQGAPSVSGGQVVFAGPLTDNPVVFAYTVAVPGNEAVSNALSATAQYKLASGATLEAAVPLMAVYRYHSADYRRDLTGTYAGQFRKIDSTEVNRVLSYWRYGYKPSATGLDGYEVSAGYAGAEGRHSADYQGDAWVIDGDERDRVLAYWRAADSGYHVDATTPDGYAPDRAGTGPRQAASATLPSLALTGPAGYNPGETVTLTCTFSAKLLALGYTPELPDGWTIESVSGNGSPELVRGEIGFIGTLTTTPVTLTYTVRVPLSESRTVAVGGQASLVLVGDVASTKFAMEPLTLAPVDGDSDGLADSWERAYAGAAGTMDPGADLDGDRLSNYEEYLCGTVPTDAGSVLKMVAVVARPDGTVSVSWQSVVGHAYTIQRADGSPAASAFVDVATGLGAAPEGRNVFTEVVDPKVPHFYRVVLQ